MAEPIHALVFSKDRAMQLDAFLRSAEKYAPYESVTVTMRSGRELMDDVALHLKHERIVFHTDDEVFFRTPPTALLENEDDVITLRQGRNTTYCHPLNVEQAIPEGFPRWKWRDAEHDFAYPLSVNATIYRSEWIRPLLNFSFENPTHLEAGLAAQHASFAPEYMVSPEHSCTVSMPHNVVSVSSNCPRGGNPEWQPDALAAKYLDGWRIDLDAMDFSEINAAHVEVPLVFKRV